MGTAAGAEDGKRVTTPTKARCWQRRKAFVELIIQGSLFLKRQKIPGVAVVDHHLGPVLAQSMLPLQPDWQVLSAALISICPLLEIDSCLRDFDTVPTLRPFLHLPGDAQLTVDYCLQ